MYMYIVKWILLSMVKHVHVYHQMFTSQQPTNYLLFLHQDPLSITETVYK